MRTLLFIAVALATATVASLATIAYATSGSSGTTELGPFHGSGIQIGGSCGNTWGTLNDITTRYSVYPTNGDGTTTAVQTVDGVLTTAAGKSPGACVGPDNGNTIGAGVHVKLHATEMETIAGGVFNPSAQCAAQCFTAAFVPAFFGPGATVKVDFSFDDWKTRCNGRYITLFQGRRAGDITGAASRHCE